MSSPKLIAGGTIYPSRFVMGDVNNAFTGLQATAGAGILGISHESTRNAPIPELTDSQPHVISGEAIGLYEPNEICLLELGGSVDPFAFVKADSNGKGVAATGNDVNVGGVALQGGASGQLIQVHLRPQQITA